MWQVLCCGFTFMIFALTIFLQDEKTKFPRGSVACLNT